VSRGKAPTESPVRRARRRPDSQPVRRWASIAETAAYLNITTRTVRQMMADGRIRAYRGMGHRLLRIDLNEIDAAMEST
jgi:excisionase family DNA binding protein